MSEKFDTTPLCMRVCRPKTKGWLLMEATEVEPVAARMCAKTAVVDVLAQMEWKLASFMGGELVLNSAGRRPWP